MYALARQNNFYSGKTAYKLSIIITAAVVFYSLGMPLEGAGQTVGLIKGYIQENTILKEHSNALFLRENWMKELNEKYKGYKINKLADGVIYVGITKNINSHRVKINVAEVNTQANNNLEVIPISASKDKIHSRSAINKMIKGTNTIIAVNGTYFKPNTGTPLGTLVINNEIISGPIYDRAAFGIGKNGYKTARLGFVGHISRGDKKIEINNINQARMLFSDVIIYTNKWGAKSPVTKPGSKHLAVKNGKIIADSDFPLIIPENGYVITGPKTKLTDLSSGDNIKTEYRLNPEWEDVNHIISGGPYLLKKGEIYTDTKEERLLPIAGRNPRTAIGYTKDNVLILVTVDGRKEGSSGVTISELAKIMKDLDCYEAINLDGGSSTVMYAAGNIYKGTASGYVVPVSNALTVRTI